MTFRGAIAQIFGTLKDRVVTAWREINGYSATFSPFTGTLYANETCRACVRTLAEHTSKANARVTAGDKRLETLLNVRPNMYMNGKDFLYKVRTIYEIHNTAFVYINRDDRGQCIGLYPIPWCASEAVDYGGDLYIRFYLPDGTKLIAAWGDLAVLRKDYNTSDIWGDGNDAITSSLDLLQTANQGMANAIKSTANLRGIVKSTKPMLSDADVEKTKERFVSAYMGLSNTSGIAALDATQEYIPLNIQPQIANYKYVEELRANIYRYFGMNEKAVTSQLVGDDWEAFYEAQIEPFLIALGLELSYKIYTDRQRGYGNAIIYEANRMQFMSTQSKLALVQMVDRRAMTPNEWRAVLNLSPLPGGDELQSWQNPKNTTPAKGADADAGQNGSGVPGDESDAADGGKTP